MTEFYKKYMFDLPIIPKVVADLINISSTDNISSKEIENIIKIDPYLTSRILKISNSSYYSREREISTIKDSVTLLGLKKIQTIALLITGSEIMDEKIDDFFHFYWDSSLKTAFLSKKIAIETGKEVIQEDIFTCGLLHNIGQAILHKFSNEKYNKVINNYSKFNFNLNSIEIEEFGVTSNDIAGKILESWGFPKILTDTVQFNLDKNSHSQFQNIIDIISFSKTLYLNNGFNISNEKLKNLQLTYQSRLNLRNSDIEYYTDYLQNKIENIDFYNSCLDTIIK
ncbi:MAG: HDOD domain-containing protein [Spirochaetales bacterium]|nr:HDOD domain-containing protein [Spirochaetales bacterium]